jgi:hypothetical protein
MTKETYQSRIEFRFFCISRKNICSAINPSNNWKKKERKGKIQIFDSIKEIQAIIGQ